MRNPRARIWVVIAVAVAVVAVVVAMAVRDSQFRYDEQAHRNVIEAYGGPVADWGAYRDATLDACDFDEKTFELYVLMESDLSRLQLDIQYACPDRMDEFTELTGMAPLD